MFPLKLSGNWGSTAYLYLLHEKVGKALPI